MSKPSYNERIGPLFLKRTQSKKGKINSKIFAKTDNKSHAQTLSLTHMCIKGMGRWNFLAFWADYWVKLLRSH